MVFEMCAFVSSVYGFLLDFKLPRRLKLGFLILNLFISVFEFSSMFFVCVVFWLVKMILVRGNGLFNVEFDHFSI